MDTTILDALPHAVQVSVARAICERAGIPVVSQATVDAKDDIMRRLRLGLPVSGAEIDDVLYAVAVALDAAGHPPLKVLA